MRFGFHLSISGGFLKAIEQGRRLGCETAQIFSRNPRAWAVKPLDPREASIFRRTWQESGLTPLAVHLPYLPNPASPDTDLRRKSIQALAEEMRRAALLGAQFVVFHPGHHGATEAPEKGLARVAPAVIEALAGHNAAAPILLLETTSGQHRELGAGFHELAEIIKNIEAERPDLTLGVCLDTAHVWGAGYDLRSVSGLEDTLDEFERLLGLSRLRLIHLNDSLVEKGSRRDRHAALGRGRIGARGLARLVRHPALVHLAGIMETPRASLDDDLANMARVKRWRLKG